jgi:hypothetical protein
MKMKRSAKMRMGNSGNDSDLNSQIAEFEGKSDRVYIPKHLGEFVGLKDRERVDCLLLVLSPGHYRLALQAQEKEPEGDLADILATLEAARRPGDLLKGTDSEPKAAIPFRVFPITALPKKGGWRLVIPEALRLLAPSGDTARFVYLGVLAGYLEIWFPETLRHATSVPLPDIIDLDDR